MNRKTCIVAEGGGFRASYGVGVIKALVEEFDITSVDMAVATSGSAGTLAYFVTGQFESILNIWTNLLSTWRFLGFRNILLGNPVLNVDYLIDIVFRRLDRLDVEALRASSTELYIAVTDYHTGEAQYFSNHDDVDFFEVLRAAKAIEIFYGKAVEIGERTYVDGALSVPLGIAKAIEEGATDIIVISTRPKGFRRSRSALERIMLPLFTRGCPAGLRSRMECYPRSYNSVMDFMAGEIAKGEIDITIIQPESRVIAGKLDNSRKKLILSIEQGYADACLCGALKYFGKRDKCENSGIDKATTIEYIRKKPR